MLTQLHRKRVRTGYLQICPSNNYKEVKCDQPYLTELGAIYNVTFMETSVYLFLFTNFVRKTCSCTTKKNINEIFLPFEEHQKTLEEKSAMSK